MKSRLLILLFGLVVSMIVPAAAQEVILPPGSVWEYTFSDPTSDPAWNVTTAGGWSRGAAPFGTSPGLNADFEARTQWKADGSDGDDLWVKTVVNLSKYDHSSVKWHLGVDNGYTLYINGLRVSSGNAEGYTVRWEYSGQFPVELLRPSDNIVAVALEDHGGATAFDMQITGEVAGPNNRQPNLTKVEIIKSDTLKPIDEIAIGQSFRVRLTFAEDPGAEISETVTIRTSAGTEKVQVTGNTRVIVSEPILVVPSGQ